MTSAASRQVPGSDGPSPGAAVPMARPVAMPAEPRGARLDLPLLITIVLVTVALTLFLTWLLMLGPRDRELASLADAGRRTEAGVSRAETAITRTEATLTRIEREVARVKASVALVAATQLRDAVMSGQPYAATLAALEGDLAALPGAPAQLTALRDRATQGIPDLRRLADGFSTAATDALTVEVSGEDAGWFGRMAARFGAVTQYTSLRMGVDAGLSPSGDALRRIWASFSGGDLGAIDATGLSPAAARAMRPWLSAVRERHGAATAAEGLVAAAKAAAR